MRLEYGDGKIHTQQGVTSDGLRCITLKQMPLAMPLGSKPTEWQKQYPESDCAVVLAFKNLEGARVLQDELNELVSIWSREAATVVPSFSPAPL